MYSCVPGPLQSTSAAPEQEAATGGKTTPRTARTTMPTSESQKLLRTTILMLRVAYAAGAPAIVEHPETVHEVRRPDRCRRNHGRGAQPPSGRGWPQGTADARCPARARQQRNPGRRRAATVGAFVKVEEDDDEEDEEERQHW
ncbi:unnamed protein product [Prorocentrum cordatum]|uniref:Uncharacterized protein n=1 Tax=Prorocentrum cordatum TaxID=2364126 RepID=A0ABN9SQB3_9DINO|nr:unnamed protein product [Polarella glacialis]